MYSAYITKLKNVQKHPNADRLQIAECFGNSVIVGLDMVEDQLVLYFPVDGQLDTEFATKNNLLRLKDEAGNNIGGYLDPEKRNITALKLRGAKSDGLVLKLESLSDYCDIAKLEAGEQITILGGKEICKKYVPVRKMGARRERVNGNKTKQKPKEKTQYELFKEHVDTAQLAYNQHVFNEGDLIYITSKLHGSSGRSSYSKYKKRKKPNFIQKLFNIKPKYEEGYAYVCGSRRVVLDNFDNPGGWYGTNKFRQQHHDKFINKLHKGESIFYEIVGYTDTGTLIMGECDNKKVDKLMGNKDFSKKYGPKTKFTYGCNVGESKMFIYRMTMTNEDGVEVEYPWELVKLRAEEMGLEVVPEFDKFIFTTIEDLLERVDRYIDGEDTVDPSHVREGIVVRLERGGRFKAFKSKNFSFKVLEGIIKENSDAPDMEEAQDIQEETQE